MVFFSPFSRRRVVVVQRDAWRRDEEESGASGEGGHHGCGRVVVGVADRGALGGEADETSREGCRGGGGADYKRTRGEELVGDEGVEDGGAEFSRAACEREHFE